MMPMPEQRKRHGVIVLAAGSSQRLGQAKALIEVDGETLVHRALRLALDTQPDDCIVVSGVDEARVANAVSDLACRNVICADARLGLAASLKCGLLALDPYCQAALIVLTDQPRISSAHLRLLCSRWHMQPEYAVASGYADTLGVPAVLPRAWFAPLMENGSDHGARDLLRARPDQVRVVPAPELDFDIDTPGDLARLMNGAP
jgi:molybdenum cofactor cytidylyltransferase